MEVRGCSIPILPEIQKSETKLCVVERHQLIDYACV